jgi:phosphoglycolate phosphatase
LSEIGYGRAELMVASFPRSVAAVLFDLDGTLLDSRQDIAAACNHALVSAGRAALPVDEIGKFVGDGARRLVARAFGLEKDSPEVDPHLERFLRYYEAHPLDYGRAYPGVFEVVGQLAGTGLGVCTNKGSAITVKILEALGLGAQFGAVVGGGDAEALKPSPLPVLLACSRLGVSPSETLMIGDSEQDVSAARAAGCYAIGILGGFQEEDRLRASGPDLLLPNFAALLGLIPSWPFAPRS